MTRCEYDGERERAVSMTLIHDAESTGMQFFWSKISEAC